MTRRSLPLAVFGIIVAGAAAFAAAPRSKDVMQPVETTPGSLTDTRRLLKIDLDKPVSVGVNDAPIEFALHQLHAQLGIDFGFMKDVDQNSLVTYGFSGTAREALHALGSAARIRFEVVGPTQIRVLKAAGPPPRKPAAAR